MSVGSGGQGRENEASVHFLCSPLTLPHRDAANLIRSPYNARATIGAHCSTVLLARFGQSTNDSRGCLSEVGTPLLINSVLRVIRLFLCSKARASGCSDCRAF